MENLKILVSSYGQNRAPKSVFLFMAGGFWVEQDLIFRVETQPFAQG